MQKIAKIKFTLVCSVPNNDPALATDDTCTFPWATTDVPD